VKSAAATPDLRARAQLADKDPEAVMLDFVQPTGSGGGTVDERGFARADETDRRESSPAGRGGAPDVPQTTVPGSMAAIASKAAAVTAMRIM
jgi:hypothetical protein